MTPSNAEELAADFDIILDGTDNFETRYLINDLSVKSKTPWIYGAAVGSYGVVMPVVPGRGPCLACIYPDAPVGVQPTCDVNGVISAVTASVAALQVAMALRLIAGWHDFSACGPHAWTFGRARASKWRPVPAMPSAGSAAQASFAIWMGAERTPVSLCGRNAVQLHENARPLDLQALAVGCGRWAWCG